VSLAQEQGVPDGEVAAYSTGRKETALSAEKFALVTGSSRGIGRAVNEALARGGYTCVVHYRRDEEGAHDAARSLKDRGARALIVRADLGNTEDIENMFAAVRAEFGMLDVFVANAASTALRPLLEAEPRHAERTYRETVLNLILSLRHAAGLLRDGGRIVYVSGAQSRAVFPGYGLLGPAKAAGEEMIKHLAVELGGRRITANAVVPGFIETISAHERALHAGSRGRIFHRGDRVVVRSGPFKWVEGLFDRSVSANGRVRILLDLVHGSVAVQIEAAELEPVRRQ